MDPVDPRMASFFFTGVFSQIEGFAGFGWCTPLPLNGVKYVVYRG